MNAIEEDHWINRSLGQLGIYVRQNGAHDNMRFYLECLKREIEATREFLRGDGAKETVDTPPE